MNGILNTTMKKILCTLLGLMSMLASMAQENVETYQKAITIIENSQEFKNLKIDRYTLSKMSISFINNAYAFHLEDPDLAFIDYDFDNYFGELFQPVTMESFYALREKRRAKHVLHVSETEQDHFIIEMHSHKRKKRGKYPKFYQGTSHSFLFKKEADGAVKYLRTIKISNQ